MLGTLGVGERTRPAVDDGTGGCPAPEATVCSRTPAPDGRRGRSPVADAPRNGRSPTTAGSLPYRAPRFGTAATGAGNPSDGRRDR